MSALSRKADLTHHGLIEYRSYKMRTVRRHAILLLALLSSAVLGCDAESPTKNGAPERPTSKTAGHSHGVRDSIASAGTSSRPYVDHRLRSLRSDGDADNPKDIDGNGDVDTVDKDDDSHTRASRRFPDADDAEAFDYGNSASHTDALALANLVRRYYIAAHASSGKDACLLMDRTFARAIPATYGPDPGTHRNRRGESCESVMTQIFERSHRAIPAAIVVVATRIQGDEARVVFASRTEPASQIDAHRDNTSWTIVQTLGSPLP